MCHCYFLPQVSYSEGGKQDLEVTVELPSGEVIMLDTRSGNNAGSGTTIDVDWREVR